MKGITMNVSMAGRRAAAGLVLAVAAAVILTTGRSACAMFITQSTAGALLYDGFESPADSPPNPPAGWTVVPHLGGTTPDVEDSTTAVGNPVAEEGTQYLAVRHANDSVYQTFGDFTSGTITAKFAFYLANSPTSGVYVTFIKSAGTGIANAAEWFGFGSGSFINTFDGTSIGAGLGGVDYYAGGSGSSGGFAGEYDLTMGHNPFTFTLGAWHEVTMTYDIAAGGATTALTITVDGQTLDDLPATNTLASGHVVGIQIFNNTGAPGGFVDAFPGEAPEPASLTLLCGGAAVLLRRGRKVAAKVRGI